MKSRRFDAVIFDLFGTLIYNAPPWGSKMNAAVAASLRAPVDDFVREWADTGRARTIGAYASVAENVEEVCRTLGVEITPEQVERAVATRLDYTRRNFKPKPGAMELLRRLREMSLKIGLLSNCTPEIPTVWQESVFCPLFDVTVFSCEIGMAKPQPEVFELAGLALVTPARRCVYVADNADGELEAALTCGLYPVLLRPSEGEVPPEGAERWQGPAIDSLPQLLGHLRPRS